MGQGPGAYLLWGHIWTAKGSIREGSWVLGWGRGRGKSVVTSEGSIKGRCFRSDRPYLSSLKPNVLWELPLVLLPPSTSITSYFTTAHPCLVFMLPGKVLWVRVKEKRRVGFSISPSSLQLPWVVQQPSHSSPPTPWIFCWFWEVTYPFWA